MNSIGESEEIPWSVLTYIMVVFCSSTGNFENSSSTTRAYRFKQSGGREGPNGAQIRPRWDQYVRWVYNLISSHGGTRFQSIWCRIDKPRHRPTIIPRGSKVGIPQNPFSMEVNPRSFRFQGNPDYACVPSDATNVMLVNDQGLLRSL